MRILQTRNSIQVFTIMEIISHCIKNAAVIIIIFSSNSPKRSSDESGNNPWEKAYDFHCHKGEWSIDSFASKKATGFRHCGPLMFIYLSY